MASLEMARSYVSADFTIVLTTIVIGLVILGLSLLLYVRQPSRAVVHDGCRCTWTTAGGSEPIMEMLLREADGLPENETSNANGMLSADTVGGPLNGCNTSQLTIRS